MKDHASTDDHERTLAWLEDALDWAYPRDRARLVKTLDLVRTEILFDEAFSEGPPRDRMVASGPEPGA